MIDRKVCEYSSGKFDEVGPSFFALLGFVSLFMRSTA